MNFVKYNPETKAIDLSTVYTSEQVNSVCIDGLDTSILKPFLQPKEVDDLQKPIFEGEVVDFVLPTGIFHDDNGFYFIDRFGEKHYEDRVSLQASANEPYATDGSLRVGETTWYIQARLLWVDGAAKAQKISGYEKKTIWVLEEDESLKLPQAKAKKLLELSNESLQKADELIPDYKKMNALFAIYPEETKAQYAATMLAFRNEYYRCKALVDAATTIEEVQNIVASYPTELVN